MATYGSALIGVQWVSDAVARDPGGASNAVMPHEAHCFARLSVTRIVFSERLNSVGRCALNSARQIFRVSSSSE
jgi:hypothetical protein